MKRPTDVPEGSIPRALVVVVVESGCVRSIVANTPIRVLLLDKDIHTGTGPGGCYAQAGGPGDWDDLEDDEVEFVSRLRWEPVPTDGPHIILPEGVAH